jgi:multidrug efflux pump subunit AcrB
MGLIGVAALEFAKTPTGFIPEQAQGYLINVIQLPPGSTLDHTEKVVQRGIDVILGTKGVEACGAVRRSSMIQPSR